jgi:hypothetical protein
MSPLLMLLLLLVQWLGGTAPSPVRRRAAGLPPIARTDPLRPTAIAVSDAGFARAVFAPRRPEMCPNALLSDP